MGILQLEGAAGGNIGVGFPFGEKGMF